MDIQAPPSAYSIPYSGAGIELRLPLYDLNIVCHSLGIARAESLYGCSKWSIGGCLIVIPAVGNGITSDDQDRVRAHELAHCDGWPVTHPH